MHTEELRGSRYRQIWCMDRNCDALELPIKYIQKNNRNRT